jgi:hypothetical protein
MDSTRYIGMDVHKESISIAVMNSAGKLDRVDPRNESPDPFAVCARASRKPAGHV